MTTLSRQADISSCPKLNVGSGCMLSAPSFVDRCKPDATIYSTTTKPFTQKIQLDGDHRCLVGPAAGEQMSGRAAC
jgi:hypothetical protein